MLNRLFTSRRIFVCLLAMGVTTLLGACGGGDGGDDPYPKMEYIGVNTEAVIDQTNADDFPFIMLESSSSSGNLPVAVSIDADAVDGVPNSENIKKATGIITGIIKNSLADSTSQVTGVTESQSGSCGGQITATENVSSSSFSGSIRFDNFCELDPYGYKLTLHGLITVSGNYFLDVNDEPVFTSLNMTIRYIKITFSDGITTVSDEFSGSLNVTSFDVNNEPVDFTMSVNFKYEGKVFKIVNFEVDDFNGTISGTFYHPDHGYVLITTTSNFTYNSKTEQFCDGTLHIEGSDGTTGTVDVEFTANIDCTKYNICISVNGGTADCTGLTDWDIAPTWPTPTTPAPGVPAP